MGQIYNLRASSGAEDWESGALYWGNETGYINMVNQPEFGKHEILAFDANRGSTEQNPMAGHASGGDVHPYSIYLVPLITY